MKIRKQWLKVTIAFNGERKKLLLGLEGLLRFVILVSELFKTNVVSLNITGQTVFKNVQVHWKTVGDSITGCSSQYYHAQCTITDSLFSSPSGFQISKYQELHLSKSRKSRLQCVTWKGFGSAHCVQRDG